MKYKVGDKVRVTGNTTDHDFQIGPIVSVTEVDRKDTNIPYECEGKGERYYLRESDVESITPLTFDHNLALSGSPVYLDGMQIFPKWYPKLKIWQVTPTLFWNIDGSIGIEDGCKTSSHYITTIPPVTYKDESRWVWVSPSGYKSKEEAETWRPSEIWQLCEVKIKVKQ